MILLSEMKTFLLTPWSRALLEKLTAFRDEDVLTYSMEQSPS